MLFSLFLSACTNPCESPFDHGETKEISIGDQTWRQTAITDGICGSAFITSANIDNDQYPEILISNFGRPDGFGLSNGFINAYSLENGVDDHKPVLRQQDNYIWPNELEPHDMDKDGDLDIVVGFGFLTCNINPWTPQCGALTWLENTGEGTWVPQDIVPFGNETFYHKPLIIDLNQDGFEDILATAEDYFTPLGGTNRAEFHYFRATDHGVFESEPLIIAEGMGSIPQLYDVDQDGDLDVISGEYFAADPISYVWLEQQESPTDEMPAGVWQKHVIDDSQGPTIQIEMIENLLGDGIARAIGSNHSNTEKSSPDPWASALVMYTPGADPTTPWESNIIFDDYKSDADSNQAAPGVFSTGDVDGDMDIDILVSGDGDATVYLFLQTEDGFEPVVISEDMPQAGVHMVDANSDGQMEFLVGSYDLNAVLYFERIDNQ